MTAAILFGLDEEATAHALALALSTSSGTIGRPPEARTGRWFLFGSAVASGIRAAEAAKQGLQGDLTLLDSDWLERFRGIRFDRTALEAPPLDNLYATLSQKPYCTGRQCLTAGQAFRALVDEGLDATTVTAIRVRVPPIYAGMISVKPDKHSRSASIIGAPLQMALAALKPEGRYLVDRSSVQTDDTLTAYAQRVSVVPDEALQTVFPQQWPAVVEADGPKGTAVKEVFTAYGDPTNRMTEAALADKAHAVLDATLGRGVVTAWLGKAKAAGENAVLCRELAEHFAAAMQETGSTDSRTAIPLTAV
jgi:2-methylcitrate dehydratase PrpD